MITSMPNPGLCPQCDGLFAVVARTGVYASFGALLSEDILEWQCSTCGHLDEEIRRQADGIDGDWPASKFAQS